MDNKRPLIAHLCLFCSGAFWGLMAPVGKDAMLHGIDGIDLVSFRVLGGALLFWIASFFTKREHIPTKDIIKMAGAGIFGLVCNQCCYRSESHLAKQLQHHDYFDAYLRHDSLVPDSEGTYHLEEGYRCADGMQRSLYHHPDECYGWQC